MKWLKIILALTVIVCLLLILVNAGRWLVSDQTPRKSDVIIVLSGDPARTEYGGIAALYLGMGPRVTDTLINRSPLLSFIFNP